MKPAPCDAVSEDLVAYLDGELPETERARIESHVATCIACRREMERLLKVSALLEGLPRIEPTADFDERMWQRLRVDGPSPRSARRWRPALWGLPALAAAAVIAVVVYSNLSRVAPTETVPPVRSQVAAGPVRPDGSESRRVAGEGSGTEPEGHPAIAAGPSLAEPPPELLEHPEMFLRYPVVRRLNKLEHFEEVRQHGDPGSIGQPSPPARSFG